MVLAETLALLAVNQDEQSLAYEEVISVLGTHDDPVSMDPLPFLQH